MVRLSLASRLRDQVTIRRSTNVPDGKGGFTRTWSTIADKISAEVISQGGREALVARSLQGISTYKITIRTRPGIRTSDQVLYRLYGETEPLELNIRSVMPDHVQPREALVIFADTESPQGALS